MHEICLCRSKRIGLKLTGVDTENVKFIHGTYPSRRALSLKQKFVMCGLLGTFPRCCKFNVNVAIGFVFLSSTKLIINSNTILLIKNLFLDFFYQTNIRRECALNK